LRVLDERGGHFAAARGRFTFWCWQLERGDAYGRSYDDEAPQHLAAAACLGADLYIEELSGAGGAFPARFAGSARSVDMTRIKTRVAVSLMKRL